LVPSSAMSMGDLAVVTSGLSRLAVALVLVTLGADGVSQGTAIVEVVVAGPQLSDDVRGLLWDLLR
jgi:hypothetical protein